MASDRLDAFSAATGHRLCGGQVLGVRLVSNGSTVWLRDDNECGFAVKAVIVSGLVVTADCNGPTPALAAYKLSTGALAWTRGGAWVLNRGDRDTTAARHLYVTGSGGQVADLNPATGATQRTPAGATSVLAIDGSRAHATCGAGHVCGYNASTGARQWKIADGAAFAAEAGGVLYLADGKALNASTGTLIKQIFTHSGGPERGSWATGGSARRLARRTSACTG